jgi:hypothetical protein
VKVKIFNFIIIILTIVIIFGFFAFKIYKNNLRIRESLPYVSVGEKIKKLEIVGINNKKFDESLLKKSKKPILILIFSRPCSPCDKNIIFWNKISDLLSDKVLAIGIIIGELTSALDLSEKVKLNFNLYVPKDIDDFVKSFRLKLFYSQTIVYLKTVKIVKIGELSNKDATELIIAIKELSKTYDEN